MSNTIALPTKPGEAARKGICLPLRGPFVKLRQGALITLGGNWIDFLNSNPGSTTDIFDLEWGYVVYQNDGYGIVSIAGYYYDTSD